MAEPASPSPGSLSRRDFVKASAATAASLPFAGTALAVARSAHAAGSDSIKIGIIGCGGRGTGAAKQALTADKGNLLWAMGDVFPDRLDASHAALQDELKGGADSGERGATPEQLQVPSEHKFTGFDSYLKVLDSGVDVVLLTGYPYFRPEHLKAAVAAGKHVFAEKPVAVDAPGVRSVIESSQKARSQNTALMIGFCWRHNTGMRAAFDKVNAGGVGEVTSVHTTYHTGTLGRRPRKPEWSDLEFQMRNWWHFTWISGDHIVEQACHSIDRLSWAIGDRVPQRVNCLGGRAARSGPEHGNVYDHFAAIYEYENALRCYHSCRQIDGCPSDNTDYIEGTHGSAVIEGWKPIYTIKDHKGETVWNNPGSAGDSSKMYQDEHDELFASIRAGKPINDGVRAANSTLMAIMARMSAYTGQTISWEQAMNSKERLGPEKLDWTAPLPTPPVAVPGQTKFV
jgi:predicted dehydrogenase